MNQLGCVVELPEEVAASVAWIIGEKDRRIAELEKDAARYRFLRNHPQKRENLGGEIHFSFAVSRPEPKQWCIDTKRGADMDAAIDAAMQVER